VPITAYSHDRLNRVERSTTPKHWQHEFSVR